jgi:hypothetical protein
VLADGRFGRSPSLRGTGVVFSYVGVMGVFTASSLRHNPPPPELHVSSPAVVWGIGAVTTALGFLAVCAALGLVLAQVWAAKLWKPISAGMAMSCLANLVSLEGPGRFDFAVTAAFLCLAVASYWALRGAPPEDEAHV